MSARGRRASPRVALALTSAGASLPAAVLAELGAQAVAVHAVRAAEEFVAAVRRGRPALAILDGRGTGASECDGVLALLKADAYTAVIPCLLLAPDAAASRLLRAGADEVIASEAGAELAAARVAALLRQSLRDLAAQPTTHLPGAAAIERELERCIASGAAFAACYADLDHFKEFNDRYGFHEGDRVIRMVARILHDAAVGVAGAGAFVGHVGGDDFMSVLPLPVAADVCALALDVFDTLVPLQYTEADRRAGYYFGKDRRGQLHRVPLMTLSIGVATTERRRFRSAAEVSSLASEMKSFAKARPGSVYAVDRRGSDHAGPGVTTGPTPTSSPTSERR